ncbi:MAG TPA: transposase [Thermoanaerobaculia bacterium]|nr:transposase [Thermoanaerobaculia bacterium]
MARPLRIEFPGALFHVFSRGDAKQRIFLDPRDRRLFLDLLGDAVSRFGWILYAYALMPNHFHLMVQLTDETLSKGMHWLNGTYALAFNQRHGKVGHVLQGRFKSPPVEKESYLVQLIRYIVLNPVRANIVARPEDDLWTSYRATLGLAPVPQWLAIDDVLSPFGPDRQLARAAFRDFVNAAVGVDSSFWKELIDRSYVGSEEWRSEMRSRVELKPRSSEYSREQRGVHRPCMDDVVAAVAETFAVDRARIRCGPEKDARMIASWIAWNRCLLTGAEIGSGLQLTGARVSQLIRLCDGRLGDRPFLRDAVSTACRKLKI